MEGANEESIFDQEDLLFKILRHLPTEFLNEVQFVNKQFYKAAAQLRLEKGHKNAWLWIKNEKDVSVTIYTKTAGFNGVFDWF